MSAASWRAATAAKRALRLLINRISTGAIAVTHAPANKYSPVMLASLNGISCSNARHSDRPLYTTEKQQHDHDDHHDAENPATVWASAVERAVAVIGPGVPWVRASEEDDDEND